MFVHRHVSYPIYSVGFRLKLRASSWLVSLLLTLLCPIQMCAVLIFLSLVGPDKGGRGGGWWWVKGMSHCSYSLLSNGKWSSTETKLKSSNLACEQGTERCLLTLEQPIYVCCKGVDRHPFWKIPFYRDVLYVNLEGVHHLGEKGTTVCGEVLATSQCQMTSSSCL